jgi:hypothetical protein
MSIIKEDIITPEVLSEVKDTLQDLNKKLLKAQNTIREMKLNKFRIVKYESKDSNFTFQLEAKRKWGLWIKFDKINKSFEKALAQLHNVRKNSIKKSKLVYIKTD